MIKDKTDIRKPVYSFLPSDIEGVDSLAQLALDMRWSWNHTADEIWQQLDRELWDMTHNPWVVLQTVSKNKLQSATTDPIFSKKKLIALMKSKEEASSVPAWFQKKYPKSPLSCCVAYF